MPGDLVITGWFVSAVISKLVGVLYDDYIKGHPSWKKDVEKLESSLPQIKAVVETAEKMVFFEENQGLILWLQQLKDALEDAESMLDEVEYMRKRKQVKAGKTKVGTAVFQFKNSVKHVLKQDPSMKRLKEAVDGINRVAAAIGPFLHLINIVQSQNNHLPDARNDRVTSSLPTISLEEFSRKEEMENVIKILTSAECASGPHDVAILPIVGDGGMGKTTLAQQVFDDNRIQGYFDLRIWVCVSNDFNASTLTRSIAESAECGNSLSGNLDRVHRELKDKLMCHKFLLVLDDCWYDEKMNPWETLLAPLMHGKKGSKILLTTRLESVVRILPRTIGAICLKGLEEEKVELLLERYAFVDEKHTDYLKLVDIRRKIAKRLRGSPLAAKVIGGVLRSNLDENYWLKLHNSDLFNTSRGKGEILPVLKLSYQYLPSHLRPCFAFCSVFPQDHYFKKEELVSMWVALGFVRKPQDSNTMDDTGLEYFDALLVRSFFDKHPKGEVYVMHDLLHDLAKYVAGDECIHLSRNEVLEKKVVRHLSIKIEEVGVLQKIPSLRYLCTLILVFKGGSKLEFEAGLEYVLQKAPNLRVLILDIRDLFIKIRPKFPKSFRNLHQLRVVNIKGGSYDIDCGLENLINLRHLIATEPHRIFLSSGVGKLSFLEELTNIYLEKNEGYLLSELGTMNNLVELGIHNLGYVQSSTHAKSAKLSDKKMLKKLSLNWDDTQSTDFTAEVVLDGLQPNQGLKRLDILNYMGARSPIWMGTASYLTDLTYLSLHHCKLWKELPSLPANLSELHLFCVGLTTLPSEEIWQQLRALQVLHISECEELRSLGGLHALKSIPKSLTIEICPTIVKAIGETPEIAAVALQGFEEFQINLDYPMLLQLLPFTGLPIRTRKVDIKKSIELKSLPDSLWNLTALQQLYLEDLNFLQSLPNSLGNLTALQKLYLNDLNFLQSLPDSLGNLTALQELHLKDLYSLQTLPDSLGNLTALRKLYLISLNSLQSLPDSLGNLTALQKLCLKDLNSLQSLPDSLRTLTALRKLYLISLNSLQSLPDSLGNLTALQKLCLEGLSSLQSLPDSLGNLTALQELHLKDLYSLQTLPDSLGNLPSLLELELGHVPKLQSLPNLPDSVGNAISHYVQLREQLMEQLKERRERLPHNTTILTEIDS